MDAQLQVILDAVRTRLKAIYDARLLRVILFGSRARGDAVAGSDIDLLIVLRGPVAPGREIRRTGAAIAELSLHYDVLISCTFIADERFANEHSPLLLNVRREGVVI